MIDWLVVTIFLLQLVLIFIVILLYDSVNDILYNIKYMEDSMDDVETDIVSEWKKLKKDFKLEKEDDG